MKPNSQSKDKILFRTLIKEPWVGYKNAHKTAQKREQKRTCHRDGSARQTLFTHFRQE